MDAQQALADLMEISSQVQEAVVFDDARNIAAATVEASRADTLVEGAARLLQEAQNARPAADVPLTQLEAATREGSVFVVADGETRIAATTAPNPTVGLVFYDLKSALRSLAATPKPAPKKRAPAKKKPPGEKQEPAAKKRPPRKKKTDAP